MSSSGIKKLRTSQDRVTDVLREQEQDFIQNLKPLGSEKGGFGLVGLGGTTSGSPIPAGNYLNTAGGTMIGPVAYYPTTVSIASNVIDISLSSEKSSTYVILDSATTDLITITGAQFSGQDLILQGKTGSTITVKNSGNIVTSDGADYDIVGLALVRMIYDEASTKWRIYSTVGSGGGGGGAGLGDNNVWTGTNEFQNTVTVEDANFGIRDQSDNTKVANFQCSGISTGTTRIYTLPDSTTSLAGLGVTTQTFTGNNYFDTTASGSTTSAPIKFQGDGNNTAQRVLEIGKYGAHGVKFIAEILGDTGRTMTNPDGGADIPVPGSSEPALAIKGAMIMNTYTMYDLDTLVFSQGVSSTTPPPADDWVYIEANTGTSGTPSLTGMTYNVPTSKTHQFKVNGSLKVSIDDDIDFEVGSTLEISNTIATPSSLATGAATALPSNPTAYFKVHYGGADRYIPYYT